jgi:hypothetical protein
MNICEIENFEVQIWLYCICSDIVECFHSGHLNPYDNRNEEG